MRVFVWGLAGFVAGLVVGYLVVLGGWIGYSLAAHVADHDGGKFMHVALLAAPVGGLAAGLLAAFALALRAARRLERRAKPY
jgi:membrane associated rhomboid family serine protease